MASNKGSTQCQFKFRTSNYIRLITFVVFWAFTRYYRIRKSLPREVRKIEGPYLLLSNHVGYWDPFIIGHFLPRFTHFVSSDAAFRTPIAGFFLPRLGVIPKKKNIRDTQVIRDIIHVLEHGEGVGIFPEAVRNWAGNTLPIDSSIGKLVKLLQVPVIVSVSRGMHQFNPRWSKTVRKTHVKIDYELLFTEGQLQSLKISEINHQIKSALYHDEVEWQKNQKHAIRSRRRAEHINHVLFICPACHAIGSFSATGNKCNCRKCKYSIFIDNYSFFHTISDHRHYFDNIRDWYDWQEEWMLRHIQYLYDLGFQDAIFEDTDMAIYHGTEDSPLKFIENGTMRLFTDRIEITYKVSKKSEILNLDQLLTINPQVHEKMEIMYADKIYRAIGNAPGVSGLKWEIAVNALWRKMGQDYKLSPYIKIDQTNNQGRMSETSRDAH